MYNAFFPLTPFAQKNKGRLIGGKYIRKCIQDSHDPDNGDQTSGIGIIPSDLAFRESKGDYLVRSIERYF